MKKLSMRILHRYLGFFLAGIMAVYALSGIVLIFRETDFLKKKSITTEQIAPGVDALHLGKALKLKRYQFEQEEGDIIYFKNGEYNKTTGVARISKSELPFVLEKMTKLHKATTNDPLYWLNIFFGCSLLFFVLSAFWMYLPKTKIFKAGLVYALAGVVLTLVLLFV
ncbi:MAG: PepSY domain-containing protein [Chitinophagaceae bacterium]|nr:PepSY domain-containing protein [Chitinophagaceae bacterium]